ncbi:hypothetical protein RRG08_014963 [Elysia crispata]|uniref:Uncharacterized protein n=1 Tax=Elysia crispata TaxID=231223 RepID=A0AAE1DVA2_9GAST|nr:hypothetical protein RRG08_014963 [Elysia crispata]
MDDYKREIIELVGDRPLLWDPKNSECRAMAYGRRGLDCGMARVDKPCATCRMEGAPEEASIMDGRRSASVFRSHADNQSLGREQFDGCSTGYHVQLKNDAEKIPCLVNLSLIDLIAPLYRGTPE